MHVGSYIVENNWYKLILAFDEVGHPVLADALDVGRFPPCKEDVGHILNMRWSGGCSTSVHREYLSIVEVIPLHFQSIYAHWRAFQTVMLYHGGVFGRWIQGPENGVLLAVQ